MKAHIDRNGEKSTVEGPSLIDLVKKVLEEDEKHPRLAGEKRMTMVEIEREPHEALDRKPE